MTDNQQKFADEYIIDCNASRAYKAAYPNVKKDSVARANGSRLLANANIKAYIEEKLAEISSKKTAEATEVTMMVRTWANLGATLPHTVLLKYGQRTAPMVRLTPWKLR